MVQSKSQVMIVSSLQVQALALLFRRGKTPRGNMSHRLKYGSKTQRV